MTAAEPSSAEPILRLRGVGRRFGGLAAVSDVDLDVAHGERRAILGPNGAGKTTLFNLIAGDIPATSGRSTFLGEDLGLVSAAGRAQRGIGRTYQKSRLFLGLRSRTTSIWPCWARAAATSACAARARDRELRDRARELAGAVGLGGGWTRSSARSRTASSASSRWHGARHRTQADAARRAGLGSLAGRARGPHRSAPGARLHDHADADRARHGRRPARRRDA